MGDLAQKRVHDRHTSTQRVFAATGIGVAAVETAGDSVGPFRLACECEARDLAGGGGWVVVATPDDVLACEVGGPGELDGDSEGDAEEWIETGFGPAVAVGVDQGDLLAAGPDGEVGRVVDVGADPTDWLSVADVDGAVRAIDGPLVGASDGVYRFTPDGIFDVGLDDVRDVSAAGAPFAATGHGLFRLGNGWLRELDGAVDVVAGTDRPASEGGPADVGSTAGEPTDSEPIAGESADTESAAGDRDSTGPGDDGTVLARGYAAAGDQLYEYRGMRARERQRSPEQRDTADRRDTAEQRDAAESGTGDAPEARETTRRGSAVESDPAAADGTIDSAAVAAQVWRERSTPAGPVVAVAYGQRTYALAADGTFLLDRGDEWATQALGLPDAVALATPE